MIECSRFLMLDIDTCVYVHKGTVGNEFVTNGIKSPF